MTPQILRKMHLKECESVELKYERRLLLIYHRGSIFWRMYSWHTNDESKRWVKTQKNFPFLRTKKAKPDFDISSVFENNETRGISYSDKLLKTLITKYLHDQNFGYHRNFSSSYAIRMENGKQKNHTIKVHFMVYLHDVIVIQMIKNSWKLKYFQKLDCMKKFREPFSLAKC